MIKFKLTLVYIIIDVDCSIFGKERRNHYCCTFFLSSFRVVAAAVDFVVLFLVVAVIWKVLPSFASAQQKLIGFLLFFMFVLKAIHDVMLSIVVFGGYFIAYF